MEKKIRNFSSYSGSKWQWKLIILTNELGLNSYEYIDSLTTYSEALEKLEKVYSKTINNIYARWKLAQEKQREGKSMDAFVNRLMVLARDCNFADVTAILGINMSTMTPYHPQGNCQCERFNGNIWKIVRPLLHSHNLDI